MKRLKPVMPLLAILLFLNGCKHAVLVEKGYWIANSSSVTDSLDVWFCKSDADKTFSTWSEINGRKLICRIINCSSRDIVIRRVWGGFPRVIRYKDYSGEVKTWQSGWLSDCDMGDFYMLTPQVSTEGLQRASYAEFTIKIPDDCAVLMGVSVNVEYLTWEEFTNTTSICEAFRQFISHSDYVHITL